MIFWLLLALLGLGLMQGVSLPFYAFFYHHLPGFGMFRIPAKFFFFVNFGLVMMAANGCEYVAGRRWSLRLAAACFIIIAALVFILLAATPVRPQELGNLYSDITRFLFLRSLMRTAAFLLLMLGAAFIAGIIQKGWSGFAVAMIVFLDLFFALRLLNSPAPSDFYRPNKLIQDFIEKPKTSLSPPRVHTESGGANFVIGPGIDVMQAHAAFRDSLGFAWALYFNIDNLWAVSSFYPMDVFRFKNLLRDKPWSQMELIMARSGVQYVYDPRRGFMEIPESFPRAMIFYQAKSLSSQDEVIKVWPRADFAADRVVLLEGEAEIHGPQGLFMSEPAQITMYENERVEVEAAAKADGWLVLLDYYYPGWKAQIDGKPAPILRADGFFRAVSIPPGRHTVTFDYHPDYFYRSLQVAAAGFAAWLILLLVSFRKRQSQ